MDDDIAAAVAEFVQQGGEIKQLPDEINAGNRINKGQTRFNFAPETRIFAPPSGSIRADYYSDGKNLSPKQLALLGKKRRLAIKRHNMHGKIAHMKRQERLSTISRF